MIANNMFEIVVTYLPLGLSLALALLMLCGFFEDRANGAYHFRTRRFLIVFFIALAANLVEGVVASYMPAYFVVKTVHTAEIAVLKNRAISTFAINNQSIMFPEIMNDNIKQCYQAAASNFVENQWDKSFRDEDCSKSAPNCINTYNIQKHEDYYNAVQEHANPKHVMALDIPTSGYFLGSIWVTAANFYQTLRRLYGQPTDGKMPEPPDEKMLADYHKYFTNCMTLRPMPWVKIGDEVLTSRGGFCLGRCR